MKTQLTTEELRTIIQSLEYSIQRVRDFPHQEYEWKQQSLQPLEKVLDRVRHIKREIKQ